MPTKENPSRGMTLRLPDDLHRWLTAYAKERYSSKTGVIVDLLRQERDRITVSREVS